MCIIKGGGVSLCWFDLIFLEYTMRPNYFIFIGYLKTGGREGLPPLDPPLMIVNFTDN